MSKEIIFGIDFGINYSYVAYMNAEGKTECIKNAEGEKSTPSVIYFDSGNFRIVGEEAKHYSVTEPEKSVFQIKRELGTDYRRNICDIQYNPEELTAIILMEIVKDANHTLKEQGILADRDEVNKVVIACPAYYGFAEKNALKAAGEIAGLEVLDLINEPVAAVICNNYLSDDSNRKRILVYDLGGSSFEVSIIDCDENNLELVGADGDAHLGGKDWDEAKVKVPCRNWQEENGSLEVINEYTSDLLNKTIQITDKCIETVKAKDSVDIDEILLVGGSALMPQVKELLEAYYKIPVLMSEPDEMIAKGAAIYGNKYLQNYEYNDSFEPKNNFVVAVYGPPRE